ncbi:C45 family autoproteolytic acyltransferase/hydolase [Rhizobium sp. BR 314]|uniref:C45 family autoproteolytic acyltransferase/hydolase n=1 Tax=Rhizobium sp. BR 314 TaxID=3040013 RepID=UPI0039BFDEC2
MKTDLLSVIDCAGSPRQRGRTHGEALRTAIAEKIMRWHDAIAEAYGVTAKTFIPRFLAATRFGDAVKRHTPHLAEEVAGIAEGSNIAHETAFALQLLDEEWWFGRSTGDGHCSSLAIAPCGPIPTIIAQTMDLPRWHDGAQVLLKTQDSEAGETMVFTSAGLIGLMGVSERGVGVCVNTLSQLAVSPTGLPVAFVMRGALACSSVSDAIRFLHDVPHASGQNYQLGDRQNIATVECSAGKVLPLATKSRCSLHTNHPLASDDRRSATIPLAGSDSSRGRLQSLHLDLDDVRVTTDDVKAALAACRAGGEVSLVAPQLATEPMTVGAVVYEIGERTKISVCAGPPSVEAWRDIGLGT